MKMVRSCAKKITISSVLTKKTNQIEDDVRS